MLITYVLVLYQCSWQLATCVIAHLGESKMHLCRYLLGEIWGTNMYLLKVRGLSLHNDSSSYTLFQLCLIFIALNCLDNGKLLIKQFINTFYFALVYVKFLLTVNMSCIFIQLSLIYPVRILH